MKNFFFTLKNTIGNFISLHTKLSIFIGIVVVGGGYYIFHNTTVATRYITSTPTIQTLVSSISGTGQMSAETVIDLKPRVSSNVTRIYVKAGDTVKRGAMLFALDARDAQKAVRNAEIDLASAKLNLQKLQQPPKTLDVIQIENTISQATQAKKDATLAVTTSYQNLLNTSIIATPETTTTTDTPPTISGSYTATTEGQIKITSYQGGNGGYFSISGLASGTGIVSTSTAQPIGDTGLYIVFPKTITQSIWNIDIPNRQSSSYISNYNNYQNALQNQAKIVRDSDNTIAEQTEKLRALNAGTDSLDLQSAQLAVTAKENALRDAKETLSDYYITAPFDGVVATVGAQLGQTSSSGTALGTIITKEETAIIPLNEVDVAKVKVGQKVTLSFDAIDALEISGTVASVDSVGTVSSGVVNYNIKIALDTSDDRIKSGMSVTAAIITNIAQDVLTVPSTAIKTNAQGSYVEIFPSALAKPVAGTVGSPSNTAPQKITVQTGISNDTDTEITSGLDVTAIIVTKTILPTTTKTTPTPSLLSGVSGGNRGGAAGGVRTPTTR